MAFFDSLTASLKQKWLEFFQVNRSWLSHYMEVESVYTPDGGRRPPSYLIVGVVNALEPQLGEIMLPFSKLNPDVDALIEVLELNFDPDLELGNRFNPAVDSVALDELSDFSLEDMDEEMPLVESDDESIVVFSDDMSLEEIAEAMGLEESDDEFLETPNAAEPDESGEVLSDAWSEGTSSESERADDNKHSKDDQDISRLFPNS